jgi:Cu(I)/Ag(I) efflux system membrane protein CusA/SilA
MLRGSVLFNVRDRDLEVVEEAQDKLNTMMTKLQKGIMWNGAVNGRIKSVPTKHYL